MKRIGFNMIDLMASKINVARLGLAAIDAPSIYTTIKKYIL